MNKKVDGLELLRMIRDGEIEEGTKIKCTDIENFVYVYNKYGSFVFDDEDKTDLMNRYSITDLVNSIFEILQQDETEKIEKLEANVNLTEYGKYVHLLDKINKIIDKLNSLYEK